MKVLEAQIATAVADCDIVLYEATPIYDYAVPQPVVGISLMAVSARRGVIVNEVVPNVR